VGRNCNVCLVLLRWSDPPGHFGELVEIAFLALMCGFSYRRATRVQNPLQTNASAARLTIDTTQKLTFRRRPESPEAWSATILEPNTSTRSITHRGAPTMQNHASRHDRTAHTDGTHAPALAPLASPARWRRSPPQRSTRRARQTHTIAASGVGMRGPPLPQKLFGAGLLRYSCAPARDV
jgi:hypothetical protein